MMGLRLREGVALDAFAKETQTSLSAFLDPTRLKKLVDEKFLEVTDRHIRATAAGRQRLNSVLSYLAA